MTSPGRKTVVLLSSHYLQSKRKAGFHFLARAYQAMGWEVLFVTAPISWISWLRRDPRFAYPLRQEANKPKNIDERLTSLVLFTFFHPANLRSDLLNRVSSRLFLRYARIRLGTLESWVKKADLVVFESTPVLLLFDRLRDLNSRARFVYRVSDDLGFLGFHPSVRTSEAIAAPKFDLVSTPSRFLHARFERLPNAQLHGHAIEKELLDREFPNPYSSDRNALFLGFWPIDESFFRIAGREFPHVTFHIVGQVPRGEYSPNVAFYPERRFEETLPFLQHADVGLHTVAYRPGVESLTDSLKVVQFAYYGLPVVAPSFLQGERPNMSFYDAGDAESIVAAVGEALARGRGRPDVGVRTWRELAVILAGERP